MLHALNFFFNNLSFIICKLLRVFFSHSRSFSPSTFINIIIKNGYIIYFHLFYFQLTIFSTIFFLFFTSKLYEMHVVVKIMSVIILYWKNVFFFFAYCFIIPDIELGIWLCSHRERERERDFQKSN